jgi:hypothetical protein
MQATANAFAATFNPQMGVPVPWRDMVSHRSALVRFAKARLHDPMLAEDVVHDVFEAVLSGRAAFAGRAALRSWLTAILKHKIVDLVHQRAGADSLTWTIKTARRWPSNAQIHARTRWPSNMLLPSLCVHYDSHKSRVNLKENSMETTKVGIREFRAGIAEFVASNTPVAVTRHGQTIGYFIPTHGHAEADIASLKKASKTLDRLLAAKRVDVDAVVAEFKTARSRSSEAK